MNTKIIADTGCDLDNKLVEELNIDLLSIIVTSNEIEYKDRIDISSDEIFKRQGEGENFSTSQIPLFEYLSTFEKYAKEGTDFIYLSLSSGITGGYNNALMAVRELKQKYPNVKMEAVDSKAASVGYGLSLYHLAKVAAAGVSFEELLEFSDFLSENIKHVFTVFNMEYLYKGGRVSKTQKNIGKLLNIRPVIVTDKEGKLSVQELSRGNKVYKRMVEIIEEETAGRNLSEDIMFPVYGQDKELIGNFEKKLEAIDNPPILIPQKLGSAIGVHTGPEIVGTGYFTKEIPEKYRSIINAK